jgi:hypothetical protein
MLPAPAPPPAPPRPPSPPVPPGKCRIVIHHTLGCFNDADGTLVLPYLSPAPAGASLSLESCSAACYALQPRTNFTIAGVDDGKSCFCGNSADLQTADAKSRVVDKSQCTGAPCGGSPKETECGGPGRLLAYQYSCDPPLPEHERTRGSGVGGVGGDVSGSDGVAHLHSQHNPALSFSMRIDV